MNPKTLVLLLLAAAPCGAAAQGWNGDANLLFGGKFLQESDWEPTDHQGELGVMTNWQHPDLPVALAADLTAAGRKENIGRSGFLTQRVSTWELDLGVRHVWRAGSIVRPYLGGGVAVGGADMQFTAPFGSISDDDSGAGFWLGGGVFWTLAEAFNIGLNAKLSHVGVRLFGDNKNAGGVHLGMLVGYHWGG